MTAVIRSPGLRTDTGLRRRMIGAPTLSVLAAVCALQGGGLAEAASLPGDSWASIAKLPDMNGIYEITRAGGSGRRPAPAVLSPKADQQQKAYKDAQAKGIVQDRPTANCLPPGMPAIMSQPYPIQILLTPGEVTLIQEAYTQVRHIHTDGRALPADPDLTFNGTSIGRWDGDSLVIETVGFVPEASLVDGVLHSANERIQERLRLVDPDTLEITTQIEDPGVLAQPWTYTTRYARHRDWSIAEYVCEQNNRNSVDETGKAGIRLGD